MSRSSDIAHEPAPANDGADSRTLGTLQSDATLSSDSGGPLSGLRIIELGSVIAGPFATRLLADMGAEVIKIEAPDKPDPFRDWGQGEHNGRKLWWPVQTRNKKCITLNLRTRQGKQLFLELCARCDAAVENFRPGTLERWDLGFDRLSEANPGLILVRVSGYGQTGPYAQRAGYAAAAEAMGGLRALNGFPGQPPPRLGVSLGDSLGALFAVQGLLAALYWRDALNGGKGQVVDVSLMESCFALLESIVPEYDRLGQIRQPTGTRLKGLAPSNIFKSRDAMWMVIAANQDSLFQRLCAAMGRDDLARDPRFETHDARAEHEDDLDLLIAEWASLHDAAEIDALLNESGVVCGPVYEIDQIFRDQQYLAREMFVEHHDEEIGTFIGPGIVPKFSETPGGVRWSGSWDPGSHNDEIFRELLGLEDDELAQLKENGVI